MADDPYNLNRFVEAQEGKTTTKYGSYANALAEIRAGHKKTHWMWYIFPQIADLVPKPSATSQKYAIKSQAEAKAYLAHPILGPRLVEITQAVLDTPTASAEALMGGVDAKKLYACMTLFLRVDSGRLGRVFDWKGVLRKYYEGVQHKETDEKLNEDDDEDDEDDEEEQRRDRPWH